MSLLDEEMVLWVGATRYFLSRSSRSVDEFCSLLVKHWAGLSERTRKTIMFDIEEEFSMWSRLMDSAEHGQRWYPFDDPCDKKAWEDVRRMWH